MKAIDDLHKDDTPEQPYAYLSKGPSLMVVLANVVNHRVDAENRSHPEDLARFSAMESAIVEAIGEYEKMTRDASKGKYFTITPKKTS